MWTYKSINSQLKQPLSRDLLRRIRQDAGLVNWRAKKRLALTQAHAKDRLAWCKTHVDTDWPKRLFSDECSVEKGRGKREAWAFGYPDKSCNVERIQTESKRKQGKVMI